MSIFVPLYELLPEIAKKETRSMHFGNFPMLGAKRFEFHEMFCSDHDCDCRKAMIRVVDQDDKLVATLGYGWELPPYYVKAKFSEENARKISGVSLEFGAQQSERAHEAKAMFEELLSDKRYADRIVKHYKLFKQALIDQNYTPEEELDEDSGEDVESIMIERFELAVQKTVNDMIEAHDRAMVKIGRNDLCPCGSNKKYKKCCLNLVQKYNDKYCHIPCFSTQEMEDSDELALLALPLEMHFCRLDRRFKLNDIVIKKILEHLLDKYYYGIDEAEPQNMKDADPGMVSLCEYCNFIVDNVFVNKPRETSYKILSTLYQCILRRGYRGRAYIEFLHEYLLPGFALN